MTIRFRLASFSLLVLLITWNLNAADNWPGFRGPNFDGSAIDGTFAAAPGGELEVNWRTTLGPGYSGVSILDGHTVTMFSDGKNNIVAAFDTKTGKELWRKPMAAAYIGHDGSHDGPIATPTLADGKVFAFDPNGDFVALELSTGKEVWKANVETLGGRKPFYGFTASPVVAKDVVVVEIGGEKGKAVAGFDVLTGKLKWSVGDDMVNYQSPLLIQAGGQQVVLAVSDKKLFAIEPASGKQILEYEHGGDDSASIMVPVLLDQDRILLRNKQDSADLIKLTGGPEKLTVEKLWTKDIFKNSYCIPVYHNGFLYGFNGRVLTSVDAGTGETKWRSRAVGDGWILLVNNHLVIQTKSGSLHMGPASPDGWKETARLDLFKDISWTPPSFADGTIFSRSQKELVRLEWRTQPAKAAAAATTTMAPAVPSTSQFGKFLAEVESAQDKKTAVDSFIAKQKTFPMTEWPDRITFVYRGPAEDIAIAGDLQGSQREEPLQKVPGTDLFYYSTRLEPDVRINYRFVKNFDEMIADPNNSRGTKDRRGNPLSWIGMPAWEEPAHLKEAPAAKRGRLEKQELPSKVREGGSSKFEVYLPADYDKSQNRYPVVYVFDGTLALSEGKVVNTLDNVIGDTVQPVIAVFLTELKTGPEPQQQQPDEDKAIQQLLVQEVIPFVDSKYRTTKDPKSHAAMGSLVTGLNALQLAFQNPDLFGGVAIQSMWLDTTVENALKDLITTDDKHPMRFYHDWGLYDARSYVEGWNLGTENREFNSSLRDKGYRPAGGEARDSYGWAAWRNRTDRWLATLFPAKD